MVFQIETMSWCPFPSRLCSFLGEFFHQDEKSTWLNQAKSLTKCEVTNSGNRKLCGMNSQYKRSILSDMKSNLDPKALESAIFLFKLLGYDLTKLGEMEEKEIEWYRKRSMAETVIDYWPMPQQMLFINTFCITLLDLQVSRYSSNYGDFSVLRKDFCTNIFKEIMALDRADAVRQAEYRGMQQMNYSDLVDFNVDDIFLLIKHLDAKPRAEYRDSSHCSYGKPCECKMIKSEIIISPDELRMCVKFMNWLGMRCKASKSQMDRACALASMDRGCPNSSRKVKYYKPKS